MFKVDPGDIIVEFTSDAPGLFAGITVFDWTGTLQMQGFFPALNIAGNSYGAKFTGVQGRKYFVWKAFYTDGTYTVVNPNEPQGSSAYEVKDSEIELKIEIEQEVI